MSVWRCGFGLSAWLALCFGVAFAGALATLNAGEFYTQLQRPDWAPPGRVFGPVWTLLYTLMAVAAWRVWSRLNTLRHRAIGFFLLQLLLNGLWSWLFFAWQLGALALVNIVLLWGLIGATAWQFRRYDKAAAWLLAPYWLWVGFAGGLNYTLWQLNPGILS